MAAEQSTTVITTLTTAPLIVDTLDGWSTTLKAHKIAVRTIETYQRDMRHFVDFLGGEPTVLDASSSSVEDFYDSMGHLAASTIGQHLSAIRSWARWACRYRFITDDPTEGIEWPQRRRAIPRALKSDELTALEAILHRAPPFLDRKGRRIFLRNRRIVLIMLYGGLRRAEVAALIWNDVDLGEDTLTVRSGKGNIDRTIPLHQRIRAELETTPQKLRRGAVAGRPGGLRLNHTTIGQVFERWLPDLGLEGITAHRLRHTCATQMLKHGANLRDIQLILGHASLRTTEIYLDVFVDQQRAAVTRLPDRFD